MARDTLNPSGAEHPPAKFFDADRRERFLNACPQLEALFNDYAASGHMPSVSYGVIVDSELIFTHAIGTRIAGRDRRPDADSVYRIASMTKSFTAAAVLHLRDAGRLRLEDPVAQYVSELASVVYPTTDSPPMTIRDLLTMSAGWPQDDPWADRQLYRDDAAISALYREGVSFSNPPSVTYEYSNYGYIVLGRVITQVAGEPAIDYITRELLQPLGMLSTTWHADAVADAHRARGYRWEDERWKEEQPLPSGGDVAAFAGLHSTVRDLARWVGWFQAAWPPRHEDDAGPLSRATRREMQRIWRSFPPLVETVAIGADPQVSGGGYGYGLSMIHNGEWQSAGHAGGLPGFGSHMRWSPAHGVGVVALANVTYANVHDASIEALDMLVRASAARPREVVLTPTLKAAHDDLARLLNAWDDDLADRLFADNFFLDLDRDHWRARCQQLREAHGMLEPDGDVAPTNWLRGARRLRGERGWCDVWATLSPTVPPRVQMLRIRSVQPPSDALHHAAYRLAELSAHPMRRELDRLLAASADRDAAWKQLRLVHLVYGHCTIKEIVSGDGESKAAFRLEGDGRDLLLELCVNPRGKLLRVDFKPKRDDWLAQGYH